MRTSPEGRNPKGNSLLWSKLIKALITLSLGPKKQGGYCMGLMSLLRTGKAVYMQLLHTEIERQQEMHAALLCIDETLK